MEPRVTRPGAYLRDTRQRAADAYARRTMFVSLAAISILAASAALLPNVVVARGPEGGSPYAILLNDNSSPTPSEAGPGAVAAGHKSAALGRSVCVRLCDGAFFPMGGDSGRDQEATCGALCPDAPTAVYRERAGSDKIEDAVSASGAPYTALPVALRYRSTLDNTCACHRERAQQYVLLRDPTLRKGDIVVTPNGFMVFAGAKQMPYAPGDFTALAGATLPSDRRSALMAMQQASASNRSADGAQPSSAAKGRPLAAPALSVSNLQPELSDAASGAN
jgi:Protein of unknown function (DUF2865)